MISKIEKNSVRKARHDRTRRYISGTQERPRLNVYRSLNNIYVQIIDDVAGNTIASASTQQFKDGRPADIGGVVSSRLKYSLVGATIAAVIYGICGGMGGTYQGGQIEALSNPV